MKFLKDLFTGNTSGLIKEVGEVIDNVVTSDEERLEAERKVFELISKYENELEKNISDRWIADMNSDSWLSKNVRPMMLIFLVVSTVLMIFIDSGSIKFLVEKKWTDLLQVVLITVIGAYFGGRTLEKRSENK